MYPQNTSNNGLPNNHHVFGGPRNQQNLQQDQDGNFYDALTAPFAPTTYHQGHAASFQCEPFFV